MSPTHPAEEPALRERISASLESMEAVARRLREGLGALTLSGAVRAQYERDLDDVAARRHNLVLDLLVTRATKIERRPYGIWGRWRALSHRLEELVAGIVFHPGSRREDTDR